jgi:hypothetical protein
MHLVIAEKLLCEILEPDEPELQAVGREPDSAQRKDDGIKCWKYSEYKQKRYCWRNEEGL